MADCTFPNFLITMLAVLPHADASIWLADARNVDTAQLPRFVSWLSATEAARYASFVRPQRQRQFLLGRAMLRLAVGQMLDVPPADIVLQERPGQAPQLLEPASGLYFSISHSGHWVACAVSTDTSLGLDIEVCDPQRDVLALAQQAFDGEVLASLENMLPAERTAAFYRQWTELEARYKLGQAEASCVALAHAELSIVLCSAAPLAQQPQLHLSDLAPDGLSALRSLAHPVPAGARSGLPSRR